MAPRQRTPTPTLDEPQPPNIMASASSSSNSQTSLTAPLLSDDSSGDEREDIISPSQLRLRRRESSFSDASAASATCKAKSLARAKTHKAVAPSMTKATSSASVCAHDVSDIAREQHDFFNLVALIPLITATNYNWDFDKLYQGYGFQASFNGDYFWHMFICCTTYFFVDLLWVSLIPNCVKSPGTIVKHHLVAIAYMIAPALYPEYRWEMGVCLWVEINTWFLILRRVLYKRRDVTPQIISDMVTCLFYSSWIVIRVFIYPYLLKLYLEWAVEAVVRTNIYWHWPMIFIIVHFLLCALNLKWTHDLFSPIIKGWFATSNDGKAPAVSSGL